MARYKVQTEPVSHKGTLYGPGDVFEATADEAAGWLQAGYVVEVKSTARRKK